MIARLRHRIAQGLFRLSRWVDAPGRTPDVWFTMTDGDWSVTPDQREFIDRLMHQPKADPDDLWTVP